MMKRNLIALCAALIVLLFGTNSLFAQCGVDGKPPCKPTPKKKAAKKIPPAVTQLVKASCTEKDNFNNKNAPGNSTVTVNGVKFELVGIPSGSFCMGSIDSQDDERPVHRINISRPFLMGKYEITQAQWQAVMGYNPSKFPDCGGECPVESISWEDAQDFLRKLNKLGEGTFRLPTEAEWEYAARAGSMTKYCYGNGESSLIVYAWYNENSGGKSHPVGQKQPNDWGLYDMHGNVWEFCQDWYGVYRNRVVTDPTGPTSGSLRVSRGGYWGTASGFDGLSSAVRDHYPPLIPAFNTGFRIIKY